MPFSQTLLPEFEEEMKNTRKLLECVPDGKFDYQPHPKSMKLSHLATHIAEMPGWINSLLTQEVYEIPADYKPAPVTNRTELLEKFDRGVAEARQKIAATSDSDWQKTWTLKFGGNTVMSSPRANVIRTSVLNHLIHHRAQLGVYLRLNNVAIPGMYGASADEQGWFEQGKTQTA